MVHVSSKELNAAKDWYYRLRSKGERGMESEFMDITPARAQVLLDHNPENRTISGTTVDKYAADMKDGRWKPNGEAIILAKTGELNTGQHRLKAIIKSGKTIVTNFVFGAERADRFTIDIGRIQTAGDKATQSGVKYGTTAASIAAVIMAYEETGKFNTSRISKTAIFDRIETDKRIQEVASWCGNHSSRLSGIRLPKRIAGFIFYKLSEKGQEKAMEFMEKLRTGAALQTDNPIYVLRDRLLANGTALSEADKVELAVRTWNLWARGATAQRIMLKQTLPDLKEPKADDR